MFEPCETKGQALLTSVCMLILAAGALAVGFAMYKFGELTRSTMLETNSESETTGAGPITNEVLIGYGVAGVMGLLALLLITCAIIAPIRVLFPRDPDKREEVLR
jgi:multisubunit Na+/H+ antiporter MnhB subunit